MRITYRQDLKDGSTWESEPFDVRDACAARQGVIAGFMGGEARRAVDAESGRVIFALDAKGKDVTP